MRRRWIILAIILVVLLGLLFFLRGDEDTWLCVNGQWVKHGNPASAQPATSCGSSKITSFDECAAAGYPILESYPRQCRMPEGENFVEDIGNELEKINLIRVDNPRPNQTISSPLEINGQARGTWFFEASFPILLLDKDGKTISQTIATAQSDWMTENFVPFKAKLEFPSNLNGQATLVFKKDNPSGLPEHDDELKMPIILESVENVKIKVFFNNEKLDPEFSCYKVFPVERIIPKTQAIARVALEELLKGPTEEEKKGSFLTSINPGVKIQKLTIENDVAKVDFDKQLEFQVGGSCRVAAISAQIRETLKQFPTVKDVIISIDGRTEDILQP